MVMFHSSVNVQQPFPMVFLWFPMILPLSYEFAAFLWFSYGFAIFLWFSYGFAIFLWVFQWFGHFPMGFPMVF